MDTRNGGCRRKYDCVFGVADGGMPPHFQIRIGCQKP